MQLLGSIIYITSSFCSFDRGGLLSTLDSLLFCTFIIHMLFSFFKMGYSIRMNPKAWRNCDMDK